MKYVLNFAFLNITNAFVMVFLLGMANHTFALDTELSEVLKAKRVDYEKGMIGEDSELIARFYADNIRLLPEANPTILGKANAQLFFRALFDRFDVRYFKRQPIDTIVMDDHLAEMGIYKLKMTSLQGQEFDIDGKYMTIWKRDAGNLMLTADAWNFDNWVDHKGELTFDEVPSIVSALEPHLPINGSISFDLAAYGLLSDQAVSLKDASLMPHFYTDDAVVLANNQPMIRGKLAIKNYWDKHMNQLPLFEKLQSRTNKIVVLGSYVLQYSSHLVSWRTGQDSGVNTGKHIRIWRKTSHGGFKTQVLISAYDK